MIMALLVIMRIHFLDEPFERDEGGYAYMAQRFLAGDLIYKDYWESRPPGIVFIYALIFKLYGDSLSAVRIFSIYIGLISLVFVYLITEKLFSRRIACLSGLLYAVFSGGPLVQGSSANAEPFMILFTLAGIYLFLKDLTFFAGICFGLAFMVKQVALDGFMAVLVCMLLYKKRFIPILFLGFFTAWIPAIFYLVKNGVFNEFVYAAFTYNLSYVGNAYRHGWFERLRSSILFISRENIILWVLGIYGIYMLRRNLLITAWVFFSALAVSFGGRFFPHYFIQLVPALCILSGYSLNNSLRSLYKIVPILLLVFFTIFNMYKYYLVYSPYEVCRLKYPTENFVLTEILAKEIAEETSPGDYIYVWGSEPEIYFYSKRRCPTRFIHNHFMKMKPDLAALGKREIMDGLNLRRPKIIAVLDTLGIFSELKEFIDRYYEPKVLNGIVVWNLRL